MFQPVNVCVNYGRLKSYVRSRLVEAGAPTVISWGAISDRENAAQSACRATLTGDGLRWDSGWVEKKEQCLRFEGALPEAVPVTLTVQIRDDAGFESEVYTDTIYNATTAWRAPWIAAEMDEVGRTVYFRREFSVERPVRFAALYVCGVGYQKLFVNGEALDDAALDPANTDYSKTCQYVTYPEFGKKLARGVNCLGALVGEGWRRNALVKTEGDSFRPYAGRPMLTAMLRIVYTDGTEERILTDEDWQWGYGAHVMNDIFDGEVYDANQTALGWNRPGFEGFKPAVIAEAPGGKMRPMTLNPVLEHQEWKPLTCWPKNGGMVVDFGQNLAGVPRIRLPKMKKGQKVTIHTAEELDEDGSLYTLPLRTAKATDTYIASGDGRDLEYWQPIFTYHGFRYAMIEGLGSAFDAERIVAVELHTDMEIRSAFRCGDAQVTKIHENCVATERANQHHILTDCPQRDERQGWMNDATVRFEETPYNFEIGKMFPKLIRDIMDAQDESGAMTCTAPFVFGGRPADPVCSSFLMAGYESYLHLGNREILAETFDRYAAWENCLLDRSEDYIVNYGYYGDWAGPQYACVSNSGGDGAESAVTPVIFMSTGYSYLNCRLLSQFAEALSMKDEAERWRETAEEIKTAMLKKWYDAETGKICTGSQGAQTFALWLGILPESDAPKAAKRIHDDLTAHDYRFTTGNLCTRYLMDVLTRYGYLEDAWTLLTKKDYPSYGFMIEQEATTVWERFELKKAPGMNSHNHPMFGAVDYWFYAYLCGIRPTKPAFEAFDVEPVFPKGLLSAQAAVDTVKGQVAVRWTKRYGAVHLHVTVPFGARARVTLMGKTTEVGSGFYVFTAPTEERD